MVNPNEENKEWTNSPNISMKIKSKYKTLKSICTTSDKIHWDHRGQNKTH